MINKLRTCCMRVFTLFPLLYPQKWAILNVHSFSQLSILRGRVL